MVLKNWIAYSLAFTLLFSTNSLQASSGVKGDRADYVIVGVGTAGGLMAKRLSDDNKTSVIALHTGKNFTDSFIIKYSKNVPFSVLSVLLGTPLPFDLNSLDLPPDVKAEFAEILALSSVTAAPLYETGLGVPQPNADDRQILWAIPLPEAGGTAVNAGAYCRTTNEVLSQWEAIGGPAWSVATLQGIYKEIEHYHGQTTNPKARGHHGPISVRQDPPSKLSETFAKAIIQATGVPYVLDYNDPFTPMGVPTQVQVTHSGPDSFLRVSSATAFLNGSVMKSNGTGVHGRKLQVRFESTALRTIWEGKKAVGVEYLQNGVTKRVFANKGVIVCAGLRSSPFLLHSGIGPSAKLTSLGIPVVFDNPNVGQGLADQYNCILLFSSTPEDSAAGTNIVFSFISWLPAPGGNPNSRQIRFTGVDLVPGLTTCILDLDQPKSRGSVTINSANPLDPPVVDQGVLTDSSDLDLFVSALMTYVKDINIQLQTINPDYQLVFPDPAILDDPVLVTAFVQGIAGSNLHFQSHCRMAPLNQGGVVDPTGRVYGVQNLFVADNSINPQPTDGSPMSTGYLVAANIARLLGY